MPRIHMKAKRIAPVLAQNQNKGSSQIWVVYDFSYVHGPQGSGTSRNFLYADGHVTNQ